MATAKRAPAKAAPAKKSTAAGSVPDQPITPPTVAKAASGKSAPSTDESEQAAASKPAAAKSAAVKPAPAKTAVSADGEAKPPAKKTTATKRSFGAPSFELPPVKGVSKDGVSYTKDFDVKFLTTMRTLLEEEKRSLLGQAIRLEDEATSLIEESEMGDVQFDDEGGEGDTMVVERERDLALSAQARFTIEEIDAALERISAGTYGYSIESGRLIPRERLEAIPWATVLVEEKVGGIGRR